MYKLLFFIVICFLWVRPVFAVELGQIQVESHLNEPLSASLSINGADSFDLADIKFSLASHADYQKLLGSSRPAYLQRVFFKIIAAKENTHTLQISTRQRMLEPIVTLLLQVTEKQSSFIKKYTLLLDPETQAPSSARKDKSPATSNQTVSATEPVQKSNRVKPAASPRINVNKQSISIIAQNSTLHEHYSVYQIMRAFYLLNPQVFENGNINKLIDGSELIVPQEDLVAQVPRQRAINFVYSVSSDKPTRPVKKSKTVQSRIPELQVTESIEIKPVKPASHQPDRRHSNMQQDLQKWRSVADEFSSLSELVKSQNTAVKIQNEALQALSTDLDNHEQQLIQLGQRVNNLESLQLNAPGQENRSTPAATRVINNQKDIINRQQETINSVNQQLSAQALQVAELQTRLQATEESSRSTLMPPATDATVTVRPARPADAGAPKIITHVQQQPNISSATWALILLMIVATMVAAREWFWRRRIRQLQPSPPAAKGRQPKARQATTYQPNHSSGEIELKDLKTKKAERPNNTTEQSKLQLESNSINEVKIEIDVLLAYEQYPEAMALLESSREKFGDNPWLDIKELEVLACSRQCDTFFARFNVNKSKLEQDYPEAWKKIEKMRTELCQDIKLSAVQ